MEEIFNVFVHSALVDNLCNDSLEQLTHVCGGSLTDKQKENAVKALELIAQSKTDGDPDEELLDRQITDLVDGIVDEMPEDVKEESILRCRLEHYDMSTAEDFNSNKHHIKITDRIDLKEGAELILFECDGWNCASSAVLHQDGTLFVLTDWQCSRPESLEELYQYEWITTDGHLGVMFDGLPKYLA